MEAFKKKLSKINIDEGGFIMWMLDCLFDLASIFKDTPTQTFFQNQNTTQNPNNQLVTYNPGNAGRTQGDPSNDAWNNKQQQNAPDSHGVSMRREVPVQAMFTDAHQAPTQTLTPSYFLH
jgi:hypothetical protein